ncbi:tyrosine-type recombinase/integrase [Seleniivibrio woodruffii]|uniref:tyrosine-type recombinase/integrase n=1 Tax=Seleniivibrio woodruffii TaxID=1078050 RepID=UPI0026EBF884|nr:tyrosine-type recombinase/integrase [Seleniivibrio woodruffii]
MATTNTAICNAKYTDKPYKITDEKGMYILVNASGKYFRFDYRYAGKRQTLAIGVYPEVSLKEAREKRDEARKQVKNGIDPNELKKAKKHNLICEAGDCFEAMALEWHTKNKPRWKESTAKRNWRTLEKDIIPYIGNRPIKQITAQELLAVLRKIEERDKVDSAHRAKILCNGVYSYAVASIRADRNIVKDLDGALTARSTKNMAALTDTKEIGGLLRAIDGFRGEFNTKCALRLSAYVFLRPGELRQAEWSEIDFDKKIWKIPADKMKMSRPHIVPLSRQAMEILKEIYPLTGKWQYVFPSVRGKDRPMSNNTVLSALRRMGYTKDEMTAHGFRRIASTLLYENGWESAVVEMQLAHAERNKVKAAYNHAEYLERRTEMMQWLADYLDGLKKG